MRRRPLPGPRPTRWPRTPAFPLRSLRALVHRLRDGRAGQGHADGLHGVAQFEPVGLGDSLQALQDPLGAPGTRAELLERVGRALEVGRERRAHLVDEGLALGVDGRARRVEPDRHPLGDLEDGPRAGLDRVDQRGEIAAAGMHAHPLELAPHRRHQLRGGQRGEILAVHPLELRGVEDGGLLLDALEREELRSSRSSGRISRSPPGDQPSSARKLRIAAGRMPRSW